MGAFCCHTNQSFKPICPETLCNLSSNLMMLHIKFDQHWPTGLRDIQVSSELWQNDRVTEWQNPGRSRQIQYSPPFSKRGYKYACTYMWWNWEKKSQKDLFLHLWPSKVISLNLSPANPETNVPKFSNRQIWANSVDPGQTTVCYSICIF